MLKIRQGLDKNSASRTDILIAEKHHQLLIIKLFVSDMGSKPMGEEYRHELLIYQRLTKELISNPFLHIRNIVPLNESIQYTFEEFYRKLCQDLQSNTLSSHQLLRNLVENTLFMLGQTKTRVKINQEKTIDHPLSMDALKDYGLNHLNLLSTQFTGMVTPKMESLSFSSFFYHHITTVPELMDYLFLILITQFAMSEIGINQNDLHWGNILVDHHYVAPHQTRHYLLMYEDSLLWIDKPYTPYLYDFDRASIRGQKIPHLQLVKHGGNCPTFHPKRDLLKTLCCLYHACVHKSKTQPAFSTIARFIMRQLITSPSIKKNIRSTNASCWMETARGKNSMLCNNKELEKGVKSWKECLEWVYSQTQYLKIKCVDFYAPSLSVHPCRLLLSLFQKMDLEIQRSNTNLSTFLRHNVQFTSLSHFLHDPHHHKNKWIQILYRSYKDWKKLSNLKKVSFLQ